MTQQPVSFALSAARVLLVAVLALMAGAATAAAQPSVTASIGGSLEGHSDGQLTSDRRQNINGAAAFQHLFNDERGRVFYSLDGGTFESSGDWSFLLHAAGMTYRLGGNGERDANVFLNGTFVARRNGAAWSLADYAAAGASLNLELHPAASATVRTGYRFDHRRFDTISALTQSEHRGFASVLLNFESRTTIIGQAEVGTKRYDGELLTTSSTTITSPSGAGAMGRGPGMGPATRVSTATLTTATATSGNADLAIGFIRIAQSLADRTGIHAQASVRRTFGSAPPELVTTPSGFFDDGVYDDPFASNATSARSGLTQRFANGAEIAADIAWDDKRYTNTVALDATGAMLAGSPLRHDRVWRGGITWSQPVLAARTGRAELMLDLGYRFTRSASNDAFYGYTSHGFGLGFSISY